MPLLRKTSFLAFQLSVTVIALRFFSSPHYRYPWPRFPLKPCLLQDLSASDTNMRISKPPSLELQLSVWRQASARATAIELLWLNSLSSSDLARLPLMFCHGFSGTSGTSAFANKYTLVFSLSHWPKRVPVWSCCSGYETAGGDVAQRESQSSLDVSLYKGPLSKLIESRQLRCGPSCIGPTHLPCLSHSLFRPDVDIAALRALIAWMASRVRRVVGSKSRSSGVWKSSIKQVVGQLPFFNSIFSSMTPHMQIQTHCDCLSVCLCTQEDIFTFLVVSPDCFRQLDSAPRALEPQRPRP